jgi:hypothetical protein
MVAKRRLLHLRGASCLNCLGLRRFLADFCGSGSRTEDAASAQGAEQLVEDFWRLSRDLDTLLTPDVRATLVSVVERIKADREEYRRTLEAWIDLTEELCLEAECEHGDGTGPLKLQRVKAATFQLFYRFMESTSLPHLPAYVQPLVIDLAVRGLVEFVISLVNTPQPERSLWRHVSLPRARALPAKFGDRAWASVTRRKDHLLESILAWLLRPPALPRRLQIKINAIADQWDKDAAASGIPTAQGVALNVFSIFNWLGTHGPQLRSAVDAISIAVHWSAEFFHLSLAERVELIERAFDEYLEQIGLGDTLLARILRAFLDLTVEEVIDLFAKRNVFEVQIRARKAPR